MEKESRHENSRPGIDRDGCFVDHDFVVKSI